MEISQVLSTGDVDVDVASEPHCAAVLDEFVIVGADRGDEIDCANGIGQNYSPGSFSFVEQLQNFQTVGLLDNDFSYLTDLSCYSCLDFEPYDICAEISHTLCAKNFDFIDDVFVDEDYAEYAEIFFALDHLDYVTFEDKEDLMIVIQNFSVKIDAKDALEILSRYPP